MKTLFIGGQEDGKCYDLDRSIPSVRIPASEPAPYLFDDVLPINIAAPTRDLIYTRETLRGKRHEYSVMMLYPNSRCVIEALLSGYKPRDARGESCES